MLPYLPAPHNILVLVISFLLWSVGMCTSFVVLTIYTWRLMSCNLPPRDAIVSCCIPLGPLGMGSYSIQTMSLFLSTLVRSPSTSPTLSAVTGAQITPLPSPSSDSLNAMSQAIIYLGLGIGLFLIAYATFWLCEAFFTLTYRIPSVRKFNIGFWGFTFPLGVYSNAVVLAGKILNNSGFKIWGSICSVAVVVFWVGCAVGTVYKGFWLGQLFYAPGLEGWDFNHGHGAREEVKEEEREGGGGGSSSNGGKWKGREGWSDEERWRFGVRGFEHSKLREFDMRNRVAAEDGTFHLKKPPSARRERVDEESQ